MNLLCPSWRSKAIKGITCLFLLIIGSALFKGIEPIWAAEPQKGGPINTLTASERQSGWKLLFDGKTTDGWRGFRQQGFPAQFWEIRDGALKRRKPVGDNENHQDLITIDQFDNFELHFEWRISLGGNSGVKYLIREDRPPSWEQAYMEYDAQDLRKEGLSQAEISARLKPEMWASMAMGFECQIIDDERNEDARQARNRLTGGLYDLLAPLQSTSKPAGEFNQARILVRGTHIEHWLNGVKVLEFERESPQLKALIAQSKFAHLPGFGSIAKGHIALQDHGDEVWFRNIKLRPLAVP